MTVSVTFSAFSEETLHLIFLRRGFHARILWPVCCDINHVPVGHTGEVNSGPPPGPRALRACRLRRHVASSLLLEAGPRPYGRIVGVGRIGARLVDHPRAGVWAHCPADGRACRHCDTHNLAPTQSKKSGDAEPADPRRTNTAATAAPFRA